MQLEQTYNSENLPEAQSFEPIAEGWYTASISGADLKPTKDGTGQRINVQYSIIGPTNQGRVIFGGLNIRNKNPKAQEIGLQQLNSLMKAVSVVNLSDTDQLIGHTCEIKVKINPAHDGYDASNDVSGWKKSDAGVSTMPTAPKVETAKPAGAVPPWQR